MPSPSIPLLQTQNQTLLNNHFLRWPSRVVISKANTVLYRNFKYCSSPIQTQVKWLFSQLELVSFSDLEYAPLSTHRAIAKSDVLMFYLKVVAVTGALGSHNDGHSFTRQGMGLKYGIVTLVFLQKNQNKSYWGVNRFYKLAWWWGVGGGRTCSE